MVSYNRKERKLIQKYFSKRDNSKHISENIDNYTDKELAKELRNRVFGRYKVDFISGNEDRLSEIFDDRMLEIGIKAYILL